MPQIINGYKKHQTITQLKANYSLFSQALQTAINDYGDVINWEYDTSKSFYFNDKYIVPYINTVGTIKERQYSLYTNKKQNVDYLFWVTNLEATDPTCHYLKNGAAYCYTYAYFKHWVTVDINGRKGPNIMGIDGFSFMIDPATNRFIAADYRPLGLYNDDKAKLIERCGEYDGTWIGAGCSGLIMIDGWEITEDYPYFK